MRLRASSAVLLVLIGCRGIAGSEEPEESAGVQTEAAPSSVPARAAQPASPVAPEPPLVAPPVTPAVPNPEPPPQPPADARIEVQGLSVAVRIDAQPSEREDAEPTRTLLVSIDGATQGDRLLSLPTGFEWCEQAESVVEPVAGQPSPLVLAQAFCEHGEDEFSRDILSAVIHVGDAATPPRVLWQGTGSFSSSFGVCQHLDVPLAEVPRAGTLLIEQLTEVVFDPDRDLPEIRCRPKRARMRKLAEIGF